MSRYRRIRIPREWSIAETGVMTLVKTQEVPGTTVIAFETPTYSPTMESVTVKRIYKGDLRETGGVGGKAYYLKGGLEAKPPV